MENAITRESPMVASPLKKTWLRGLFFTRLIREILMETRSIPGAVKTFKTLMAHHREAHGTALFGKIAGVDGRYFAHLFTAGAPSAASRKVRQQEIRRVTRPESPPGLRTLMLAITKRCPLSCEHCYEADIMRGDEVMGRDDLLEIILRFKEAGTAIIWLGGGEPMSRFKDIRYLLQHAGSGMDVWVITSGYRLNEQTARALKTDGLTGAMISLDHWDPEEHNRFRGSAQAFGWAEQACKASAKAGLVAALSVCATRAFATEENFRRYMELAREWGAAFVQILEPKAAGRYKGKDVALSSQQIAILERLTLEYNTSAAYRTYPIVEYPDALSRRIGCSAAGHRYLYINSNGQVQVCPFCHTEVARALAFSAEETIRLATALKCPEYEPEILIS